MTERAVHWHEGQFLQPHHFQAAERAHAERARRLQWASPFNYGVREFAHDPDALANSRLVVRTLRAVFRDGLAVSVPDDTPLSAIDLKPLFRPGEPLTAWLAVPVLNLGQSNAAETHAAARFRVATYDLEDENTGVNPQPVRMRSPNVRILWTGDDTTGYETLPLLRLRRSGTENAPPEIDPLLAPPLLTLDAWPPLAQGVVGALYERVVRKRDRLAELAQARSMTPGTVDPAERLVLAHLRELSSARATLAVLATTPSLPPFEAYRELARLTGQLSLFDLEGPFPAVPPYDHDDPAPCFHRLKIVLDALLEIGPEPVYKSRPFVGVGARLECQLDAGWLTPAWDFVIGVRSDRDPDEAVRLLTQPGQLDAKLAAGDRADAVFRLGQAGLRLAPCPRPHVLPESAAERFFHVGREPEREFAHVARSLSLAVRVNETRLAGPIAGERNFPVRTPAGTVLSLALTLYAVPTGEA